MYASGVMKTNSAAVQQRRNIRKINMETKDEQGVCISHKICRPSFWLDFICNFIGNKQWSLQLDWPGKEDALLCLCLYLCIYLYSLSISISLTFSLCCNMLCMSDILVSGLFVCEALSLVSSLFLLLLPPVCLCNFTMYLQALLIAVLN